MIDICLNIASDQFKGDAQSILDNGLKNGCTGFILTGTSLSSSKTVNRIAKENINTCCSTAGVHPHDARNWKEAKSVIEKLAQEKITVAIGECGLDYDRMFSTKEDQKLAFKEQLDIALKFNKPAFLHIRGLGGEEKEVMDDFLEIYKPYVEKGLKGVVHCFTGSETMLKQLLDLNVAIGITGWVCDNKRGLALQKAIPHIPDHLLMIETDAPYLTPKNMPKSLYTRRNEPAYLKYVAEKVVELKGITTEKLIELTNKNVEKIFGWKPEV